jgi:hypothetical protein
MEGQSVDLQKQSSHTFDLFMEDEDGVGPDGVTVVFLPMNEMEKDFNLGNSDWEEIAKRVGVLIKRYVVQKKNGIENPF